MVNLVASAVFTGAAALALLSIWAAVAPQWRRMLRLMIGQVEQPVQPLHALAVAEHRIVVRHRASTAPATVAVRRPRAA